MKPYSADDIETDLRAAIDGGDQSEIERLGALMDAHPTPPPASMLAAALWYADNGLHVFPLQPGTKIPFKGSNGCLGASTDPDLIRRWWEGAPDANLGLATGHLVDVVDIDGLAGQKSRVTNWSMFEHLPVIAKVTTPRPGGIHLYVPAAGQGNKAGILPGVDYRGKGGYVVAPPSRTDQGAYRFLAPLDPSSLKVAA